MIKAIVFVYGHGHQINQGEWEFLQLPAPGDLVHLSQFDGTEYYAKVRQTEYLPVRSGGDGVPAAHVVADYRDPEAAFE